jgi:dihydroorotase
MKRWSIVLVILAALAVPSMVNAQARVEKPFDLLLKGGRVIDPSNGIDGVFDVAVKAGKIARIDKNLPPADAATTADVTGLVVTPGLIDIHAHLYFTFFTTAARSIIPDDLCLSSGVTTVVDAGTSGADNFEDFLARTARTRMCGCSCSSTSPARA